MRKKVFIIGLISIISMTSVLGGVVLTRFDARLDSADIVVQWQTAEEDDVKEFVLERKTRFDVSFKAVKKYTKHGINRLYEYKDTNVYKDSSSEQVAYRLRILKSDGSFILSNSISINYFPTAIQRTWGNIKAMFQ